MVVYRLRNYAHFLAATHPFIAATVAKLYMDQVFKLHGMPLDVISDQESAFISSLLPELMKQIKHMDRQKWLIEVWNVT